MKFVIFAGGIGTRMWPVSRVKTPKQFNPVIDSKSTLELMVNHITQKWGIEDVFISTNKEYVPIIREKLPALPERNIFQEPAMRDLGPAVGYAMSILNKLNPNEPVAILWCDDLIKKANSFRKILNLSQEHLISNPNQIVYIGQKPLFADQNKGWIHRGAVVKHYNGISMYEFKDWHYRPPLELAEEYFRSGEHAVNTGYFVTTPQFIIDLYRRYAPEMYQQLSQFADTWGTEQHTALVDQVYPTLDKISFDDLILAYTEPSDAVVMIGDLGWYGFGDWDSIKEALQETPSDTVTKGNVYNMNSKNCLVYNYTDQLVTPIGLENLLVVVTPDAVMVCDKKSVPEIKKMLKAFEGTEYEKYT